MTVYVVLDGDRIAVIFSTEQDAKVFVSLGQHVEAWQVSKLKDSTKVPHVIPA